MATVPLLADEGLSPEAASVFAEIRASRGTDFVNNFWRALAHDPATMRRVWDALRIVMAPGALDAKTKEMIYIAVSVASACPYCIHSHTAGAKAKGMSPAEHAELLAVIGMASETNRLAMGLGVEVDAAFQA